MIQQGRPCSFVSKFVHYNHRLERLPANQIVFAISCFLIGQYLKGWLDAYWSTVMYLAVTLLQGSMKHGYEVKNDDLVEVLNSFLMRLEVSSSRTV